MIPGMQVILADDSSDLRVHFQEECVPDISNTDAPVHAGLREREDALPVEVGELGVEGILKLWLHISVLVLSFEWNFEEVGSCFDGFWDWWSAWVVRLMMLKCCRGFRQQDAGLQRRIWDTGILQLLSQTAVYFI